MPRWQAPGRASRLPTQTETRLVARVNQPAPRAEGIRRLTPRGPSIAVRCFSSQNALRIVVCIFWVFEFTRVNFCNMASKQII